MYSIRRHVDQGLGQRLAHLDVGAPPCPQANTSHASRQIHLGQQVLVHRLHGRHRPIALMNALMRCRLLARPKAWLEGRPLPVPNRPHQVLVHRLSDKGRKGRQQLGQAHQDVVQGGVRGVLVGILFALPETPTAAAHIPVGEVVEQRLDRQRGAIRIRALQEGRAIGYHLVQPPNDPAVEGVPAGRRCPLGVARLELLLAWLPAVQDGIGHEKVVGIPQGQQELAALFVGAVVAKEKVVLRLLRAVQPTHHVHADAVSGLVELDGVAPALVHRPAVLG